MIPSQGRGESDPEKLEEARAWVRDLSAMVSFHGDRSAEEKEASEASEEPEDHRFARDKSGRSVEIQEIDERLVDQLRIIRAPAKKTVKRSTKSIRVKR